MEEMVITIKGAINRLYWKSGPGVLKLTDLSAKTILELSFRSLHTNWEGTEALLPLN